MKQPSVRLVRGFLLWQVETWLVQPVVCLQDRMLHFNWLLPTAVAIWLLATRNLAYS